jgi:hydroxymethylglutaryl-CoA lyase
MEIRGRAIRITEVGPRDGLQNEPASIATEVKVAFINALAATGVAEVEVGSFVSPKAVPQLADSDEVARKISRRPGVTYSALVPNLRGLERAMAAGIEKIAVFTAASETFTQHNIHASIAESLARFEPVMEGARKRGLRVRGYVSTAVYCPYDGLIPPVKVRPVVQALLGLGVDEISLGDTIGKASPADVRRLLDHVLADIGPDRVSLHFHDTYGMAVANALTAWSEYGVYSFDSSAGGLGGCPYAPGASGNVATEDLIYALRASGASVTADEGRIVDAVRVLQPYLGRPLTSRLAAIRNDA